MVPGCVCFAMPEFGWVSREFPVGYVYARVQADLAVVKITAVA